MAHSTELRDATPEEFNSIVERRRRDRMNKIDALPPAIRACVHDYGNNVVMACLDLGVKNPRHIRHLVETVLNEFSPTRGANSSQGIARAPGIDGKHLLAERGK